MRFHGPGSPFRATASIPGDKSLSHRALLFGAMAQGRSRVAGIGPGADIAATVGALRVLGIDLDGDILDSKGVDSWRAPLRTLDAANSATTLRLLAGALAGRPFSATIGGDASLMRRPMRRLIGPLESLGATVSVSAEGTPPVTVIGGDLHGAAIAVPVPSAQVRTAAALAALQADGPSIITSPPGYRDHTERWLSHLGLGADVSRDRFQILPGAVPTLDVDLPGDPSSAAFLWVAASVLPGAMVRTPCVSLNPGRMGILDALAAMGATISLDPTGTILGDPVGDVTVTGGPLTGIDVGGTDAVRCLDELPALAVAAAHADGPTTVTGAGELRVKESDRIASTVAMIRSIGGDAEPLADGFVVGPSPPVGGRVDATGDHRIAMAAAVAATRGVDVEVTGFDAVGVSWPAFATTLEAMWSSR